MYPLFFFKSAMVNAAGLALLFTGYKIAVTLGGCDPVTLVGVAALLLAAIQTALVWADDDNHESRALPTE